jgi:apolipoprotein N-acyltransferase
MNPHWLLPILSGIFIGTSYIPFPPWASLFCFVPLWVFWMQQTRLKDVLIGGMITAFVFTLIGFNWITYLLHEFAHVNWFIAGIGMVVYSLLGHLFVPVAGIVWFWGRQKFNWSASLSLALLALITILSERYSFTLFDWNFGYSWYGADIPVYQWAEIIGFSGLSALTLLSNLPLYVAWQQRKHWRGKLIAVAVLGGFMALNAGGVWLKNRLPIPDASFTTLLAQASTDNSEKMAAELGKGKQESILRRYMILTDQALDSHKARAIDFAIWPETAFPALLGDKFTNDRYPIALMRYVHERQLPLITGAYSMDDSTHLLTNSLFAIDKQGSIIPPHYSKTILLAFGEYIPGEQWFPALRKWLPDTGQFARGTGSTQLMSLAGFKIGAQICYEGLFPQFSRDLANLGAQFFVNTTNDSWYGTWQEPYQHLYMTLARGVEFRRPVLRATNTGISTVALASGEILKRSPIHQPWSGVYNVAYLKAPPATFYQQWFWLVPVLLWGILLVLLGLGMCSRFKGLVKQAFHYEYYR